jgi:hypothetical protein
MHVVGVSLVANAVRLHFPVLAALRSILPLCDELVVNVGPSDDGTLDLVRSLADPRLRIIEGRWDLSLGSAVLATETQRALDQARGDWAIYIQADEVLHEDGVVPLRARLADALEDRRVEGLLLDFLHFYGTPEWVGTSRAWYRREVRALRTGGEIRSVGDAQGFRVGAARRRIRARRSGAVYHHYGWARPLVALERKQTTDDQLYHAGTGKRAPLGQRLPRDVGLRRFTGRHPAVIESWLAERRAGMSPGFGSRRWDTRRLALLATLGIERLTGWRPFEHRNYVEV